MLFGLPDRRHQIGDLLYKRVNYTSAKAFVVPDFCWGTTKSTDTQGEREKEREREGR